MEWSEAWIGNNSLLRAWLRLTRQPIRVSKVSRVSRGEHSPLLARPAARAGLARLTHIVAFSGLSSVGLGSCSMRAFRVQDLGYQGRLDFELTLSQSRLGDAYLIP